MGHRAYSRHGNGRFRRATLENTFGLSAPACPACGRLNPHEVTEPPPARCHACYSDMTLTPHPFVPGKGDDARYCDACDHNQANERLHPAAGTDRTEN